jgi:glycosyltransferase involved in cell wall biosynthesis
VAIEQVSLEKLCKRFRIFLVEVDQLKITFASYLTVSARHGGPLTQLTFTKHYLEELGVEVRLMDHWFNRQEFFDCDLFHIFGASFATYDLARYLHDHNIPFVVSPIFFTQRSSRTIKITIQFNRSDYSIVADICRWAVRVLPNTSEEAALIMKSMNISKQQISLIPNGVEERFSGGDPNLFYKQYGIKDYILNVGHIGLDRKNTLSLIRALEGIDHPAVIIGNYYPSTEGKQCLEEAERNKNITIIQGIDHGSELLASAYAGCKVFVLPSKYETPGIAALEAALAGASIVTTPHGGGRDYFGDMTEYINPYSVNSIQKGILNSLEKPKSTELKVYVSNNFLWKNVADLTHKTYQNLLKLSN